MTNSESDDQQHMAKKTRQQRELFRGDSDGDLLEKNGMECEIVDVGKRRDGGTRYWCLSHRADATAKYGKPADKCRAAHIPPLEADEILTLDLESYGGGIALWGAVPAVYDTTFLPLDRGVHVHARATAKGRKRIDHTFRAVRIQGSSLPSDGVLITESDAIYYMITSVFGYEMRYVLCTRCRWPHLDKDWFSVRPHRRHLCAGCGWHFSDTTSGIGNPIVGIRKLLGASKQATRVAPREIEIDQADYPGGIQIWGSNPAFLWTSDVREEEGIHLHCYDDSAKSPVVDETYAKVTIDGITLDAKMVRILMAQRALPSVKERIRSIDCPSCGKPHFSQAAEAYTPSVEQICTTCAAKFSVPGRLRKVVVNPLPAMLSILAKTAPREPVCHDLELMPETL